MNIEKVVEELAMPIIKELNYELVDVEFIEEEGEWYLRVYIDKDGIIDIEDCAKVSRRLSDILDEKDPIDESYFLEVSSPGIDRPLKKDKDFERFMGSKIKITLNSPISGKDTFEGILSGFNEDTIFVKVKNIEHKINRANALSVRLNDF